MSAWASAGASPVVLDWLTHGVCVRWGPAGPPAPFHFKNRPYLTDEIAFLQQETTRCLLTGAWEPATDDSFVSPLHVVPKPHGGGFRAVVDLRHLNGFCTPTPAKFERLTDLQHLARRGDWAFSADLKDGYHQIPIHPAERRYFSFYVLGRLFRAAALPFGWTSAPWVFTKVMRVAAAALRSRGIRLLVYLDDWLFLAPSQAAALASRIAVAQTFSDLGLQRHPTKGVWEPTQRLQHLGLVVDLVAGTAHIPLDKLARLHQSASALLGHASSHARWVSARRLAGFAGLANSVSMALPEARLRTRAFFDALHGLRSWGADVRLGRQALRDLTWWRRLSPDHLAGPIWRPPTTRTLHTDASGSIGWGAALDDGSATASGRWQPTELPWHITAKELIAVRYAIDAFSPHLAGHTVNLRSDNAAVVAVVNSGTSRSPALMAQVRLLWQRLAELRTRLLARYIRTGDNHLADGLSRGRRAPAWRLPPAVFADLQRRWGPHQVDRFASAESALLPRWNSLDSDGAEAIDAFSVPWSNSNSYINAPWDLLPRVVAKLRDERAPATVIAPDWPAQLWWPDLRDMATDIITLRFPPEPPPEPPPARPRPRPPEPWRNPAWRILAVRVNDRR